MRRPAAGTVSRRRFARGVIPALAGTIAATLPWAWRAVLPADFCLLVRCRASAERIGRRYLATLAQDIDSARLLTMSPVLARALQTARHDPGTAARELRQAIDVDFHRADTVVVDGWILAATEARLCAVIALA